MCGRRAARRPVGPRSVARAYERRACRPQRGGDPAAWLPALRLPPAGAPRRRLRLRRVGRPRRCARGCSRPLRPASFGLCGLLGRARARLRRCHDPRGGGAAKHRRGGARCTRPPELRRASAALAVVRHPPRTARASVVRLAGRPSSSRVLLAPHSAASRVACVARGARAAPSGGRRDRGRRRGPRPGSHRRGSQRRTGLDRRRRARTAGPARARRGSCCCLVVVAEP